MLEDGQGTKCRRNIAENLNRLSRVHERYRRQTTDGRAIAYSKREREFTSNVQCPLAREDRIAPQHDWLLPINCHFRDCKARCSGSPCKLRYIRIRPIPLPFFTFTFAKKTDMIGRRHAVESDAKRMNCELFTLVAEYRWRDIGVFCCHLVDI